MSFDWPCRRAVSPPADLATGTKPKRGHWHGAIIGHSTPQWTVPLGIEAEIDAEAGTVRLLEPAVLPASSA